MSQQGKQFADICEQVFRQGRLILEKLPVDLLNQIIEVLEMHKSECTAALSTFRALLLRRREIEFGQDYRNELQAIFYKMVSQSKNLTEVNRFKVWFSRLRRLKSYSFKVYEPDNLYVCEKEPQGEETSYEIESMEINRREVEKLMKEDLKTFTLLILRLMLQGGVNLYEMPLEHLRRFVEGIEKHTNEVARGQQMTIIITYKRQNLFNLSAEELHENRMYLEERYHYLVEQNPNQNGREGWIDQFRMLEQLFPDDFKDSLYIKGEVLRQFQQKQRSTESENETSSLLT